MGTLCEIGFLEGCAEGIYLAIHDWKTHNPYAAHAAIRSAKSRLSAMARHDKELFDYLVSQGVHGITEDERYIDSQGNEVEVTPFYERFSTAKVPLKECLSPSPSPSPSPKPEEKRDSYESSSPSGEADGDDTPDEETVAVENETTSSALTVKGVVELWNEALKKHGSSLPAVKKITASSKRAKWVRARLKGVEAGN